MTGYVLHSVSSPFASVTRYVVDRLALKPTIRQAGLAKMLDYYGENKEGKRLGEVVKFVNTRLERHILALKSRQSSPASNQSDMAMMATSLDDDDSLSAFSCHPYVSATPQQSNLWIAYNESDNTSFRLSRPDETTTKYWARLNKGNKDLQPLALLSRDLFGLAVSSACVERLFSDAGNVDGRKRGSLLASSLTAQTSVRVWARQGIKMDIICDDDSG
jgi:hypothetical protein